MTADVLWVAIERVTGRVRPLSVSVTEYADIVGISRVSVNRMVDRGNLQKVVLAGGLNRKLITVDEVFRAFGVEMGTSVAADAPESFQHRVVASPDDEVTP